MYKKKLGLLALIISLVFSVFYFGSILLTYPQLPEFDPHYYVASSEYIVYNEHIGLKDPLSLRTEGYVSSLPLYPLIISLWGSFSGIPFSKIISYIGIILLFFIFLGAYMITYRLSKKSSLGILSLMLLGTIPYLAYRAQIPIKEQISLFFLIFAIVISIYYSSSDLSLKKYLLLSGLMLLFLLFCYPLTWIIVIILVFFNLLFNSENKKAFLSYSLFVIAIGIVILSFFAKTLLYNSLIYYASLTHGIKIPPIQEIISHLGAASVMLLTLSLFVFLKYRKDLLKNKSGIIYVFLVIFMVMLFLQNSFSNRSYLYLSIAIPLVIPLMISKIRFNKFSIIIMVFVLVILSASNIPKRPDIWITPLESQASNWISLNSPNDSLIITQKGMSYLFLPNSQRPIFGYELFWGENLTSENFNNKVIYYKSYFERRDNFSSSFLMISKVKSWTTKSYKENFLYGLEISKLESDLRFSKVYENPDVVIFKINTNITNSNPSNSS